MEKIEIIAEEKKRIFDLILENKPTLNFSILQTILRKKDIKVNNKRILKNFEVNVGDKITAFLPDRQDKEIEKIFENEYIIIANKPQGMEVTTRDKMFSDSLCMEEILNANACHRLDKNTEGLVVFAKNETAQKIMFEVFKEHQIEKRYLAIVSGNVKKSGDFLQNYLKKEQNFAKICQKSEKDAKPARLKYYIKNKKDDLFLIDINLMTGRFHQIRSQLSHHKIYVLGDEKYGDKEMNKKYHKNKQQLCAYKIKFENLPYPLQNLSQKEFEIAPSFLSEFEF